MCDIIENKVQLPTVAFGAQVIDNNEDRKYIRRFQVNRNMRHGLPVQEL